MTSFSTSEKFEELLSEAWAHCADNEGLRASQVYGRLGKWLAEISSTCCPRGLAELTLLESVVCAMKSCDYACLDRLLPGCDPNESLRLMARVRGPVASETRPLATDDSDDRCLRAALAATDEQCVGLQQFFREVAAHTCDRGALLMRVTGDVLSDFRSFVDNVFSNRVMQIGMVLAREQMAIRDRYAELECRTMNRAQLALMYVRDIMPSFDWRRYSMEPGYIKTVVVSRCVQDSQADDGDADDVRGKSLLYQLNWLRSEIDRAECENHRLHEQHSALTAELAAINLRIAEAQCQAANEEAALSAELDELRARSAEQVCAVDKLMETIHISMQNAKSKTKTANKQL